jgi:hypothetical protein
MFYFRSVQKGLYGGPRVEAGSNTSTVALRVVGDEEKGISNLRHCNMVMSPTGLGPDNDCAGIGRKKF